MKLLIPSHTSPFSSLPQNQPMEHQQSSPTNPNKVHLALGKSLHKTTTLLQWTFNHFRNAEIVILHVYQPSPVIPTLLGKMPASQANPEVVSAFRREEREQTMRLTDKYLRICFASKVKASVIVTEASQVQKGIVDLVVKHNITKLVIGAESENCMKVKRNSGKANYTSKHAPLFCEIWFIYKGRHIWTREASEKPCSLSSGTQPEIAATESLRFRSSQNGKNELPHSEYLQPNSARTTVCSGIRSLNLGEIIETEATNSSKSFRGSSYCSPQNSVGVYQDAYLEDMEERINSQLIETEREAEAATGEYCRRLEIEAMINLLQTCA